MFLYIFSTSSILRVCCSFAQLSINYSWVDQPLVFTLLHIYVCTFQCDAKYVNSLFCQLLAEKMPELLDFDKDLLHLEAASKVPLLFIMVFIWSTTGIMVN